MGEDKSNQDNEKNQNKRIPKLNVNYQYEKKIIDDITQQYMNTIR